LVAASSFISKRLALKELRLDVQSTLDSFAGIAITAKPETGLEKDTPI
jgi:hypothetical protein